MAHCNHFCLPGRPQSIGIDLAFQLGELSISIRCGLVDPSGLSELWYLEPLPEIIMEVFAGLTRWVNGDYRPFVRHLEVVAVLVTDKAAVVSHCCWTFTVWPLLLTESASKSGLIHCSSHEPLSFIDDSITAAGNRLPDNTDIKVQLQGKQGRRGVMKTKDEYFIKKKKKKRKNRASTTSSWSFFCLVGPVRFLTERLADWTRANAWPLHL